MKRIFCLFGFHKSDAPIRFTGEHVRCKWCKQIVAQIWEDHMAKFKPVVVLMWDEQERRPND